MSALGELILGCRRRGWRVGLTVDRFDGRTEVAAVEVRDRDRELLADGFLAHDADLESACARVAQVLALKGLIA